MFKRRAGLTVVLLLCCWSGAAWAGELQVGVATQDITPPIGYRVSGYFHERVSTEVHDPLRAKAIYLSQGDQKAVLVICDVISIPVRVSAKSRERIAERFEIPLSNVAVSATHTHTGPLFHGIMRNYLHDAAVAEHGKDPSEPVDYPGFLVEKIVAVAVDARSAARPARLRAGSAVQEPVLSFNRRYWLEDGTVRTNPGRRKDVVRPAGPIDPLVDVLLMQDSAGKPFASLTVFALHLDTTGGTAFSADYPFYLERDLREVFGPSFTSIFGTGTCGDVNHVDLTADRRKAAQIGPLLAETVKSALPKLRPIEPDLAVAGEIVDVPLQRYSDQQLAEAREKLGLVGKRKLPFLEEVEACKIVDLQQCGVSRFPLEVQVIRLSRDLAIVTLPGEVFVELGLAIKKDSPFKQTIVIELTNHASAYIPTTKAFKEGGYEVVNSRVQPGGGEALVEAAGRLLRKLASQ